MYDLNQTEALLIYDNIINTNAVVLMLGLIMVIMIIQCVVCIELNHRRVAELTRYKIELQRKKRVLLKKKSESYAEREGL